MTDPILSRFIAALGLLLPFALYLMAGKQESLSAYYYTAAKPAFLLILLSVAGLLAAFAVQAQAEAPAARWIAGAAAVVLAITALVPTSGPLETLHGLSAVAFFGLAAALLHQLGQPVLGGLVICGIIGAGAMALIRQPIYWPEVLAVLAFSLGWLRRGWPS